MPDFIINELSVVPSVVAAGEVIKEELRFKRRLLHGLSSNNPIN